MHPLGERVERRLICVARLRTQFRTASSILARGQHVVWALDVTGTMSGLLLALLAAHGQRVTYVPGRTVNRMAVAYQGEAKTDARDAYVIAETVRHRGDLHEIDVPTALVAELRLLVSHRRDLVADRVRIINRLRDVLTGYFPALEGAFDFAHSHGGVVLLTGYPTPAAIRGRGQSRLQAWLASDAEVVFALFLCARRVSDQEFLRVVAVGLRWLPGQKWPGYGPSHGCGGAPVRPLPTPTT